MHPRQICLLASEATPFAKTGGLADVASALTRHLDSAGHDVRLFLPMYRRIREGGYPFTPLARLQDIGLTFGDRRLSFSVSTTPLPDSGAQVHLVRCPELFDTEELYGGEDEALRFALLTRAAVEACQWLQWSPDVFHCNDWHTALLPLYLKTKYAWDELFEDTKTVLTIHNIGYQGVFPLETIADLGLGDEQHLFDDADTENDCVNFLKTGIHHADALTTVSETYAREIQEAEFGMGMEHLLARRRDDLYGIVNGVDYGEWDPGHDPHIAAAYGPEDLGGKRVVRDALLDQLGLSPVADGARTPVFGIVSRLTWQKGFEILPEVLTTLMREHEVRLAVLGSGEESYEQYFSWLQETYPQRVAFRSGYDNALAHRIEAGSDLFLMPSRYEPCGLNQMYSLRYGSVPVVRRTGGLADTVEPYDPEQDAGTGFLFDELTSEALLDAVRRALRLWSDEPAWTRLVQRGMRKDFSWARQGPRYSELYERLLSH